jgi:hypothetical protein
MSSLTQGAEERSHLQLDLDPRTASQTAPLYKQTYGDASVLVCRIMVSDHQICYFESGSGQPPSMNGMHDRVFVCQDMDRMLPAVSASDQLMWLHMLHTKVDAFLTEIHAIKVDISGDLRQLYWSAPRAISWQNVQDMLTCVQETFCILCPGQRTGMKPMHHPWWLLPGN